MSTPTVSSPRPLSRPLSRQTLVVTGVILAIVAAIVVLALIVGASFPSGVGGVAALFVLSALLGATFGALSNGFGLIMRQEEALIGAGFSRGPRKLTAAPA